MEVNFFALVEMTRAALPLLKQGRRPIIVNVSSILGRRGVPHNSEYAASKFAVHGFSESIRAELAGHPPGRGVDVLVVSPGTTDTEFFDQVIESKGGPKWPEHKAVTPDVVARATVRGIRRGSHEITPYLWGKVLVLMNRISPWLVDKLMARYA
jgi:short-subunit dehydrogenase